MGRFRVVAASRALVHSRTFPSVKAVTSSFRKDILFPVYSIRENFVSSKHHCGKVYRFLSSPSDSLPIWLVARGNFSSLSTQFIDFVGTHRDIEDWKSRAGEI